MAIAKELDDVDPRFIQVCPLCERKNRMVVHGLFVDGDEVKKHPDMGYSFCNCKNIFYTNKINVTQPILLYPDKENVITYPDPFFAWANPYEFKLWDVRRFHIIWDMESLVDTLKEWGYEVISYERDFDVNSPTPQCFHIKVGI